MEIETPVTYEYIDTPEALNAAYGKLSSAEHIAVDLEADSMYHYREKVCLIQLAANGDNFVIDPLAVPDLSILRPIFADRRVQKIFHGADYDVRSLYRDFGIEICNLFDTELASRFLGVSGTGLDAVVMDHLNIRLEKKYQKKDWSKRPLPYEMIDYAARDVLYLLPISNDLIRRLADKNRLDWVTEECEYLSGVRPAPNCVQPLFMKVKGAGRLNPRALAALENILELRREAARKKDKPLFKVFSNRAALSLAVALPGSPGLLFETGILSPHQASAYGEGIVKAVDRALKMPESDLPAYPRKRSPRAYGDIAPRMKALQQWRNEKGRLLEIDPGLVCNRSLAARLAALNPASTAALAQVDEMKSWQKAAFGEEIVSVLKTV